VQECYSPTDIDFEPNEINDHFADSVSSGDVLDNSDIPSGHLGDGEFTFDEVGILDALESISSNACGFDGVSLKFLKLITEYVIDPLTYLVNYSLSTSCFSKHWKRSVLTPIPKKRKEIRGLDDLRPISILPRISKVVKRVEHNQLAHYLCVHGLFDEFQSGFRKSHSTTTTLLKVSNDLRESFNRGMVSLLFRLDLSKAFDKINHCRLHDDLNGEVVSNADC
jgi:hypothetical protein